MEVNVLDINEIKKSPYSRVVITQKTSLHKHTFFEFCICLNGNYKNTINGVNYDIKKGNIILLRPQDVHEIYSPTPHIARDIYVKVDDFKKICDSIDDDLFEQLSQDPLVINFNVSIFDLKNLENELNYFNATEEKSELSLQTRHRSAILHILDLWQQSLTTSTTDYPEWLSSLIAQINTENFLDMNINEIIEKTNYSHGYVCREFKKFMGVTLQEYISKTKFSYAKAMLQDKNVSIKEIAYKLNYGNVANFIIAFKNRFGLTPSQYKKSLN